MCSYARVDQRRIGLLENPEQRQARLGRDDVLALGDQKTLLLQPSDDFGSGRRCADALGFLQPFPQALVIDKAPGVLHRLDQGALVVARRRARLLVLDGRVFQPRDLAVAQGRQQLGVVALFVRGLPVGECRAPPEIDGLATRRAESEAAHVKRRSRLAVAEVGHGCGQIRPRDDVEQLLLVERKPRPDLAQVVHRVDVGNDGVVARPFQPLVVKTPARSLRIIGGSGTGNALKDFPTRSPATIRGTSFIKLSGR